MSFEQQGIEKAKERMRLQSVLVRTEAWQTCLNCLHWVGHSGNVEPSCSLFKMMPPPRIIVNGCEKHENDIPF